MDIPDIFSIFIGLGLPSKPLPYTAFRVNLLPVHDGTAKRLELDLLYGMAAYWPRNLLWLQPKKQ